MSGGQAIRTIGVQVESAREEELAAVTSKLLDPAFKFPTLPAVAAEIMNLANSPDVNFRAVDRLVRRDPILAARVLAVANSPLYRAKQEITSLRTAMMTMGWNVVREILWQVLAESHVFRGGRRRKFAGLRQHAVGVAHITRQLCQRLSCDSEYSFVCGLLHDLGRPLTLQVFAVNPEIAPAAESIDSVCDALHTQTGARVADAWGLPQMVKTTIQHHHDFDDGVLRLEDPPLMARIVAGAERLSDHHGVGRDENPIDPNNAPVLQGLGFSGSDIEELIELTHDVRLQVT